MTRKTIVILASIIVVCVATFLLLLPFGRKAYQQSLTETAAPPAQPSAVAAVVRRVPQAPRDSIANPNDMSARKALDLATQLVKDGQLDSAARALAQHLSGNWRDSLPFDQITTVILNSSSDVQLRTLLIDFLIHAADMTADEKDRLSQVLLTLAESPDTDTALRKYALLALRDGMATDRTTQLRDIAEKRETPPEVRGAAITALRRTGDETTHNAVVGAVLDNASTAATEVLRHAVVSAAKAGMASNRVGTLREIAMTTKSAELYASTLYALGLVGNQDAVVAIMDAFGRYGNEHIARYALQRSEPAILQMLAADQPHVLTAGIQAARSGGIAAAIQPLSRLRDTHSDTEIRSRANEAIADLSAITDVNSKQQRK